MGKDIGSLVMGAQRGRFDRAIRVTLPAGPAFGVDRLAFLCPPDTKAGAKT